MIGDDDPLTADDLRELARALQRPIKTLCALSPQNDPFFIDGAREQRGQWFRTVVWDALAPEAGIHVRRLHYQLVSQEAPPLKPNGTPFANVFEDWRLLCDASRDARELGLVDAGLFVDRRAGEPPVVYIPNGDESEPDVIVFPCEIKPPSPERAPFFAYHPQSYSFPTLPLGYSVHAPVVVERYAIEVWAEKSTVNDVLIPLARRHNVTLVTGLGELSLTHCHQLVERVRAHGRKTRILYVSDFDPAGDGMPVSVARKIEFLLRRQGLTHLDIRLDPLVLTDQQVARYRLPRTPIKDSDNRKNGFEARHGTGAVELDALEALHPGEMRRILERAIEIYRAPTRLARREIEAVEREFEEHAAEIRQEVLDRHADVIAQLRSEFEAVQAAIRPHQQALEEINAEFQDRFAERITQHLEAINRQVVEFYARTQSVWTAIGDDLEDNAPDPDEVDWPEPEDPEEPDDPLFNSSRSYIEQIDRYKRHQGKPVARRARRNGGGTA